jgi:hypothetical protein
MSMLTKPARHRKAALFMLGLAIARIAYSAETVDEKPKTAEPQAEQTTVSEGRKAVIFHQLAATSASDPWRLSDKYARYPVAPVTRLDPLFELGDPFLGNGPIRPGIKTPTGQMIQPQFLLFGTLRSALQSFNDGSTTHTEWANRLDLHGNLSFSGTERLLISMRPLDNRNSAYTGYGFDPDNEDGWHDDFNARLTQVFFEGDIGEIFPSLDPTDLHTYDIGFTIGRQPLLLQDGMLANDIIDMVGFTRNSLVFSHVSNLRLTGIYGWNHIRRGNNDLPGRNDPHSANLYGLVAEADTALNNTVSLDLLYVDDQRDASAWYVGASSTQRFGALNTTFRINASMPEHETATVKHGVLLLSQLSLTPKGTDDIVYLNTFWNSGDFTSAARGPDQGSPVANLGILYAPVGMGHYSIPLGSGIRDTVGMALGYQKFLSGIDSQLVFELAGRTNTAGNEESSGIGIGARYQRTLDKHHVLRFDTFVTAQEHEDTSFGFRTEWIYKF